MFDMTIQHAWQTILRSEGAGLSFADMRQMAKTLEVWEIERLLFFQAYDYQGKQEWSREDFLGGFSEDASLGKTVADLVTRFVERQDDPA